MVVSEELEPQRSRTKWKANWRRCFRGKHQECVMFLKTEFMFQSKQPSHRYTRRGFSIDSAHAHDMNCNPIPFVYLLAIQFSAELWTWPMVITWNQTVWMKVYVSTSHVSTFSPFHLSSFNSSPGFPPQWLWFGILMSSSLVHLLR